MSCSNKENFIEALSFALGQIKGAYSIIVLTQDALYAVRDPNGFRPLVLGKSKEKKEEDLCSYAFASETCAFDITEIDYIRDVEAGELIRIDKTGMNSYNFFPNPQPNFDKNSSESKQSLCIFENIYFARPDSIIFGQSVYNTRKNLGRLLAKEHPIEGDIVSAVPDSSLAAALGYAEESQIPYATALIRSHYIGRTFIEPDQRIRDFGARIKYNVIASVIKGKRLILVDDSIMRGTTAKKLINMLRKAGVKEIHLCISAPPTRYPCYYGIDIPNKKELVAANKTLDEIKDFLQVDTLSYMSLNATLAAMQDEISNSEMKKLQDPIPEIVSQQSKKWCTACFSGSYPIPLNQTEEQGNQKDLFNEYAVEEDLKSRSAVII